MSEPMWELGERESDDLGIPDGAPFTQAQLNKLLGFSEHSEQSQC